jgi:hypothetical protein
MNMNELEYRTWLKNLNPEPDNLFKEKLEDKINIIMSNGEEVNDNE